MDCLYAGHEPKSTLHPSCPLNYTLKHIYKHKPTQDTRPHPHLVQVALLGRNRPSVLRDLRFLPGVGNDSEYPLGATQPRPPQQQLLWSTGASRDALSTLPALATIYGRPSTANRQCSREEMNTGIRCFVLHLYAKMKAHTRWSVVREKTKHKTRGSPNRGCCRVLGEGRCDVMFF